MLQRRVAKTGFCSPDCKGRDFVSEIFAIGGDDLVLVWIRSGVVAYARRI